MAAGYWLRAVMKERQLQHLSFLAVVVVLLFSSTPLTCNARFTRIVYETVQLNALQALWGEWNVSTPHPEINLAGWSSSQLYPCSQEHTAHGPHPNWRGVECLTNINCKEVDNTTDAWACQIFPTRLTLNDASIVGILPEAIGQINTLTTLELTGNPYLTGILPQTMLKSANLYNLDVHDNAFYGEIPDLNFLKSVNLGGNQFTGPFPLPTACRKGYLQKLILSRNHFEGPIPERAFENMTQLVHLDLSSNRFNGTPPALTMSKNLQIVNLSNNVFSGALPDLTTLYSLRLVDLSNNSFSGSALDSWNGLKLKSLQELYLDHNGLSGALNISKISAQGLFSMRYGNSSGPLKVLSLKNNNISNVSYDEKNFEDITTVISLQGNPYCDHPELDDGRRCFCTQVCYIKGANNDRRKALLIAVVTSVSSLVVLLIVLAALFHRNRRYKRYLLLQVQQKFEEFEVKPTIFPYNQLRTATRDFHPDTKLGQGAFGAVYKGTLPKGNVVAVKQLFAKTNQGIAEFLNEVVLLTGMKHRNLVHLKGCCIREQQRLLVYEYVDNYDVDKVLLAGPNKAFVSWPVRFKICLGVARGLHYLHALAHPRVIHRDIKASNVLLANNYDTKIADFGLALLFPDEESCIMTKHVAGTKGYLAPEYASFGRLSDKVDVFSFGVLCLEVVSGRRNIDEKFTPDQMYLSKWAWELHRQGRLMELVDQTISLQEEVKLEVHRLINIALLCIQNEAEQRPTMERVVAMLQGGEAEAVVVTPGDEDQYVESIRLFAVGNSGLGTVAEESESSFMNSSRRGAGRSEDAVSAGATLELSEITVR